MSSDERAAGQNAADERAAGERAAGERATSVVTKWINAGPDEGAIHALLDRVTERIPRDRIDILWIFPRRTAGGTESTVIVVAAFDDDPDRRTVATAHFKVTRDRRGSATVALQMQEHGSAPVGATQRVVDGVLRRLGNEVGNEAPTRADIAGDVTAWAALYEDVGGEMPTEAMDAAEAPETPDAADPTGAAEAAEARDAPDAPDAPDAAQSSDSMGVPGAAEAGVATAADYRVAHDAGALNGRDQ